MQRVPQPTQSPPHHLARSSREVIWAGVAGGLAEYFDVDPVLVRLLWVAATIVTGGLGVVVYLVLWVVMPRDTKVGDFSAHGHLRDWSSDFQSSTREFAEEARRFASEVSGRGSQGYPPSATTDPYGHAATEKGEYMGYAEPTPSIDPWADPDFGHRRHGRPERRRNAGLILIGLGLVFLANNAGLFRWVDWHYLWPLMLVIMGVVLLARQSGWRR